MSFEPSRWAALSPLLDEALALDGAERAAWLAALRARDASAADDVAQLLAAHEAAALSGFLASPAGRRVGAYALLRVIGEGGMGTVWLAERADGRFDGRFAIKLLQRGGLRPGFAERFRREGSILARLSHPNIARLVDAGLSDLGDPYLVLEYVDGERIDSACDARGLGVRERVTLFLQVLGAVAHAHSHLVIHRDLKPANVLLARDGCSVKLLDFGIARLLESAEATTGPPAASSDLTRESGPLLTPRYAAPEQWLGAAPTTASDVWALGTCLFELLTGQHPRGSSETAPASVRELTAPRASAVVADATRATRSALEQRARRRGATPESLSRALAGDLDAIIARATAVEPTQRYVTAAALTDDLHRYLHGEAVEARAPTLAYRGGRFVRRHRSAVAAATLGVATIIALAGTAAWQAGQARHARDLAIERLRVAEAVRTFAGELLGVSGPNGRVLSVEASLDHAEALARRLYADEPEVLAELLLIIGGKNSLMQRVPERERALADAAQAANRSHNAALQAHAACSAVPMEADDAAARVQAIAQRLPAAPEFARARYRCHSYLATLQAWAGDAAKAQQHAQWSEQALAEIAPLARTLAAEVHETRADVARALGQYAQADGHYARAIESLGSSGRGGTLNAALLVNYRVVMQVVLGRPREGLAMAQEMQRLLAGMSAGDAMPAYMHTNLGQALLELGRWDEAEAALRRGIERGLATGTPRYLASARGRLAELLLRRGRVAEAEPLVASYLDFARTQPSAVGPARLHAARLAIAMDEPARALAHCDEAVRAYADNPFLRSGLATAWLVRAEAELALTRLSDARNSVTRALELMQAYLPPGQRSLHLARAHLLLARALAGEAGLARAAAQRAVEEFGATVGADHPDAQAAARLAGA